MTITERACIRYAIDSRVSHLSVQVSAAGLFSRLGHSPRIAVHRLAGELVITPGSLADSWTRVVVRVDQLSVQDDIGESDRREIERRMFDVLEPERFPEIVFESTRVSVLSSTERQSSIEVGGRLALHGVTSDLAIRAQLFPSDDVQRVSGEFPLRQSDYRITRVSVAGGTLKVKDDLVCTFDIVARRQE